MSSYQELFRGDVWKMILAYRKRIMIDECSLSIDYIEAFGRMLQDVAPKDFRHEVEQVMIDDSMFFLERVEVVRSILERAVHMGIPYLYLKNATAIDTYLRKRLWYAY